MPTKLTSPADSWHRAVEPRIWSFPRDHGAHPDFKTEWWYFTGNLHAIDNPQRQFGFELTLFRQGLQFNPVQKLSQWAIRDFYFGNLAISDLGANRFHFQERVSRGALGEAHAHTGRMDTAIDSWSVQQESDAESSVSYQLSASEQDIGLNLMVRPAKPLIYEGVAGLSQKGPEIGEASYYYSYPLLSTSGILHIGQESVRVEGQSWFDQEFSTSSLAKSESGWDWFCLQLDSGEELMVYALRQKTGGLSDFSQGTWVHRDGTTDQLTKNDFKIEETAHWKSPKSQALYPSAWKLQVARFGLTISVQPAMSDQELWFGDEGTPAYWEGAVREQGEEHGKAIRGVGYVELTGYAKALGESLQEK